MECQHCGYEQTMEEWTREMLTIGILGPGKMYRCPSCGETFIADTSEEDANEELSGVEAIKRGGAWVAVEGIPEE